MGNNVTDFRLDFHVVDATITQSTWSDTQDPGRLKEYQVYTDELQSRCIEDVQTHSVDASYRTFFVNLDRLERIRARLATDPRRPYIAMNVDATGPTVDLFYDTDKLRYLPVEVPIRDGSGQNVDFFKSNTSTLVEIVLARVPDSNIVKVIRGDE
jgi:hypothetical protein